MAGMSASLCHSESKMPASPTKDRRAVASDRGRQIRRDRGPQGRLWEQCIGPSPRPRQSKMISITVSRTSALPIQTESLRSHALYLLIEHVHFIRAPFVPGLGCIGAAQFFQRFLDGEFGCFGHGKPHIQMTCVRTMPTRSKPGHQLPTRLARAGVSRRAPRPAASYLLLQIPCRHPLI